MPAKLAATLIFAACYALIFSDRLHRTIAAMAGAIAMVLVGSRMGFYTPPQAVKSVDFQTIALLSGMMIHVALLSKTGVFRYLAIKAAKHTGGSAWKLVAMFGLITALVSMVIDNVTTLVFIGPVTVLIADVLRMSPVPALVAEAALSNVGGVATLVGDPPNIMIAHASGFSFNDFLVHLLPVSLVVLVVGLFVARLAFGKQLAGRSSHIDTVMAMREQDAISDRRALRLSLVGLGVTLLLFVLGEFAEVEPSVAALSGAVVSLVLLRPDPDEVFRDIDWTVLIFFAGLFVLVGGLDSSGVLRQLSGVVGRYAVAHPHAAAAVVLWFSAAASSVVDNVPAAAALIPVIKHMGDLGVNTGPMWWALAMGVGFGGNASPFGAAANVVAISISEKTRHPIRYRDWFRAGLPMALASCAVATLVTIFLY